MNLYRHNSTFRIKVKAAKTSLPRLSRKRRSARSTLTLPKRMKRTRHGLRESRWSREVRERDNYTCQFPGCGKQGKSLDTHHIAPRSLRPDLKFKTENGVCLDRQHHNWVHSNRDEAVAMGLLNLETYEAAQKARRETVAA